MKRNQGKKEALRLVEEKPLDVAFGRRKTLKPGDAQAVCRDLRRDPVRDIARFDPSKIRVVGCTWR